MRPSTPLPRPAEMVLDPGPDHLARPDLTRAGILPVLNTEAFLAPARGMAEIGSGLAKTGSALGELAIKKQQADAIVQEHKADTLRAQTEADFQAAMRAEPDHNKWPELLTAAVGKLRKTYDETPMSAAVREAAKAKLDVWNANYDGKLRITVAGRSFDQAAAAIQDRINTAVVNNDLPAATALAQKGAAAGFWNEDKAQALTKDAEQRIQKNHAQVKNREQKSLVTNALQLAGQNPLAAGAALSAEAGAGLPPEALTQIRNGVRSIQATAFAGARQEILDVILGSKAPAPGGVPAAIVTADDIAQLAENRLHPEETRALQETLTAHQSPQISAAMAHPDKLKETFGESLARLWSYDPEALGGPESKEARNEYAAIHTAASWLPERYRRDIGEELNGKWLGTAPVLDPSNKRYFADTLKELYASDVFGRREIRESAEDGGDRVIPDPGGLKQARTGLAEAMISLLQWDQENPRAPRQEAQAALYAACARQLSEHDAARVLDGSDELEAAATGFAA